MNAHRVLLVEDDQSLGATLSDRLLKEGYHASWADNIAGAREILKEQNFALVIFDVGLPDGSGFDLAKELSEKSDTAFIFVTARATAEDRLQGYDLGAVEFIPKPFHLREFMMRVHHVLESHLANHEVKVGAHVIDLARHVVIRGNGEREKLNSRDVRLMQMLLEKAPKPVSRDEILQNLWGEDKFPTNRTIDNSIVRLRQALREEGNAICSVRGIGYRWDPSEVKDER